MGEIVQARLLMHTDMSTVNIELGNPESAMVIEGILAEGLLGRHSLSECKTFRPGERTLLR